MNRWVYISAAILGVILSIMEITLADNIAFGYTFLLSTIMLISALYFAEEWRFYRQHNALLASSQFLLIPGLVLLTGNLLAPRAIGSGIVRVSVSLSNFQLEILSSYISALLILPLYVLYRLFKFYYTKEYPGFVVRRRTYGPTTLPLVINLTIIGLLWLSSSYVGYMDLISVLHIVVSLISIISIKILPVFSRFRQQRSRQRRPSPQRVQQDRTPSFSSSSSSSSTSSRQSRRRSSRSGVSTRPSSGIRSVSTRPSEGYRDIPVRPRHGEQSQDHQSSRNSRSSQAPVVRSEGIEVIPPSKAVKSIKSSKIGKYLPKGNVKREDLKCIVCYEAFKSNGGGNVIVCPSCKFPAHERELRAWLNQSEMCPRCSKEIISMGALRSSSMISEKQYSKIVNKI